MPSKYTPYFGQPGLQEKEGQPKGAFYFVRDNFFDAGVDSHTLPPAQSEDSFEKLDNILPPLTGILKRRWGYQLFNNTFGGVTQTRLFTPYQNDTTAARRIIGSLFNGVAYAVNEDGTIYNASITTLASTPRVMTSRSFAYLTDSATYKKWDGSAAGGVTNWGIVAPVTTLSVGVPAAGVVTLNEGRNYFVVFQNGTTGHTSDLSPVSASTGPLTSQNVPLTSIPTSADAQVTKRLILATADGGDQTTLYLLTTIADNVTTTFTDNVIETTLLSNNIYLETDIFGTEHGVSLNTPPPVGMTLPTKHRGRIFGAQNQILWFSKSFDEVTTSTGIITGKYEEAFPGTHQMDISEGAETVRGLFSDGQTLWIGTERHVRRLDGDGPQTFVKPDIAFNEVGVMNNEVWKAVFIEGQPVGAMWLTPDFRVILSDFNTYSDVGIPIQDTLNSINPSCVFAGLSNVTFLQPCATFFADGEYAFYVLAIPTGANNALDTLCIYDMHMKKWYIWKLTDTLLCMVYNVNASGLPQLVMTAGTATTYQIGVSLTQDRVNNTPVSFAATIRTPWFNLGDATVRKILQQLQVTTADTGMTVTVEAANTDAEFTTPTVLKSSAPLVAAPLGGALRLPLVTTSARHHWYRFTFTSPASTVSHVLSAFALEAIAVDRL